ncbi:unnamed protein product [Knipowitschia caucasica]|uniref:BZIP domain-containing protein n=1 Tax=Knipowitschia caucasica TaxID=637954 RepID=A0AAV2LJ45_KNICA
MTEGCLLNVAGQEHTGLGEQSMGVLRSSSNLGQTLRGRSAAQAEIEASSCDEDGTNPNCSRRKREFIPDEKKDVGYWDKRKKNNEAAKRSREKRRANDMVLERRVLGLLEENAGLRAELMALKFRFGLVKDPSELSILPLSMAQTKNQCVTQSAQSNQGPTTTLLHQGPTNRTLEQSQVEKKGLPANEMTPSFNVCYNEHTKERSRVWGKVDVCSLGASQAKYPNRLESPDCLKSLPHKLRFKCPVGEGVELSQSSDSKPKAPPVATVGPSIHALSPQTLEGVWGGPEVSCQYYASQWDVTEGNGTEERVLRSQVSCLSEEVAQLKRLFSQQLLTKIA